MVSLLVILDKRMDARGRKRNHRALGGEVKGNSIEVEEAVET